MRDIQQLHGTGRESERVLATIGDSEGQPAKIGESERQSATPWDRRDIERRPETIYKTVRDNQ